MKTPTTRGPSIFTERGCRQQVNESNVESKPRANISPFLVLFPPSYRKYLVITREVTELQPHKNPAHFPLFSICHHGNYLLTRFLALRMRRTAFQFVLSRFAVCSGDELENPSSSCDKKVFSPALHANVPLFLYMHDCVLTPCAISLAFIFFFCSHQYTDIHTYKHRVEFNVLLTLGKSHSHETHFERTLHLRSAFSHYLHCHSAQ